MEGTALVGRTWQRHTGSLPVAAFSGAALATAVGATAWLTAAAAERASPLSPPSDRVDLPWVLGPLHGLLPHLSQDPARLHRDLLLGLALLLVAWVAAWLTAPSLSLPATWTAVGLAVTITTLGPPQALTDVFNYLSYGRMAAHGTNPYRVTPFQGAPHDVLYHLSNWHHLRSPYGPLFTLLSEPLGLMPTATAFLVWKVVAALSVLGVLVLTTRLAVPLGRSPQRVLVAVALCPATLVLGLGGFHNDPPAILAVVGALACLVRARDTDDPRWSVACGALVVLGCGLKPSFAVVLPALVIAARHPWRAAAGAAMAGVVTGVIVLIAFGGALPDVRVQGRLVSPLSLPNLLGALAGRGGADATVRALCTVTVAVVTLAGAVHAARRPERIAACCGGVLLASALALTWGMPWYVGWALPFVALAGSRTLAVAAVATAMLLGIGGLPQGIDLIHALGYVPSHNPVGLENHLLVRKLVR